MDNKELLDHLKGLSEEDMRTELYKMITRSSIAKTEDDEHEESDEVQKGKPLLGAAVA